MIRDLGIGRSASELRAGWVGYFALDILLLAVGITAKLLPDHSNFATSTVLGAVLALAGVASLLIGGMLVFRLPFERIQEPGAMAGLALSFAGIACIVMALARRNLTPETSA